MQRGILRISVAAVWLYPNAIGSGAASLNASLYLCKNISIMAVGFFFKDRKSSLIFVFLFLNLLNWGDIMCVLHNFGKSQIELLG